ncbi:MAG: hypothetical protein ACK54J_15490 [Pseudanabaena sp.]
MESITRQKGMRSLICVVCRLTIAKKLGGCETVTVYSFSHNQEPLQMKQTETVRLQDLVDYSL